MKKLSLLLPILFMLSCEVDNTSQYQRTIDSLYIINDSLLNLCERYYSVIANSKCTLCYDYVDSVNGEQYYVGFDGVHYKLYADSNAVIRQVFFKDTTVTRYIYKDSAITMPNRALLMLTAKGTKSLNKYPNLNIYINGQYINTFKISSEYDNDYAYSVPFIEEDIDSIRIQFDNDHYDPITGDDRNCFVSDLKINNHDRYFFSDRIKLKGGIWWDENIVTMAGNSQFTIYGQGE